MSEMAGYFYPRTATGRSSLLPPPPWYYSGDLLTIEYRTDPARVARLLPQPLEPAPDDPGAVALIWADWQSCGVGGEELLDPVRAQYKECFAVVRCRFGDAVYSRCAFIWVDSDFALARGLVQGYPKKLGSIHQTRPHPFGRAAPRISPGGTFAGTLSAAGRRLAQAVVTLREESASNGFVNAQPMAHHRWMPSITKGAPDSLSELIASGSASVEAGQAWRGDATLELFDSPTEELADLEVHEIIGGYYRHVGVTGDGGTVLAATPRGSVSRPVTNLRRQPAHERCGQADDCVWRQGSSQRALRHFDPSATNPSKLISEQDQSGTRCLGDPRIVVLRQAGEGSSHRVDITRAHEAYHVARVLVCPGYGVRVTGAVADLERLGDKERRWPGYLHADRTDVFRLHAMDHHGFVVDSDQYTACAPTRIIASRWPTSALAASKRTRLATRLSHCCPALPSLIGAALTHVQPQRAGAAAGILTTTQQFGAGGGIAVIGAVFYSALGSTPSTGAFALAMVVAMSVNVVLVAGTATTTLLLPHRGGATRAARDLPDREDLERRVAA